MSSQLPRMGLPEEDVEMIEIPRFKKRELNLGIVRKHPGKQRAAWLALGGLWVVNGLLSLVSVNPVRPFALVVVLRWRRLTSSFILSSLT